MINAKVPCSGVPTNIRNKASVEITPGIASGMKATGLIVLLKGDGCRTTSQPIKLTSAMVNVAASDATIKVLTKNLPKNQ